MMRASWLWASGLCGSNAMWAFGVGENKGGSLFGALSLVLLLLFIYTEDDAKKKEKKT